MKRRARRVTIAAAVLGAGVVGVLAVVHWGTIRDHVEVWRFQLTRETEKIEPPPGVPMSQIGDNFYPQSYAGCKAGFLLLKLSSPSMPVIVEYGDKARMVYWSKGRPTPLGPVEWNIATPDLIRRILAANHFRVLEQRFPRRAYVVIHDQGATR